MTKFRDFFFVLNRGKIELLAHTKMSIFGHSVQEISQKDLKMHQPAPVSPIKWITLRCKAFLNDQSL